MKPIVGVLLLLSVVIASAAAFVLEDPDFDEYKESLALAEKEQKNENEVETGELQNAPSNSKSNCVSTCAQEYSKVVCVRKFLKICVKRATYKYCSQWRTVCSRSQRSEQFVPYQNTDERQQQGKRTTNDEDAVVLSDEEEQKAALAAMNSESAKAFRTLYDAKVSTTNYSLCACLPATDVNVLKDVVGGPLVSGKVPQLNSLVKTRVFFHYINFHILS